MTKRLFIAASVLFLLISGCKDSQEKKTPVIPALLAHSSKPEINQKPYYPGLIQEYRTVLQEDPNNLAAIIGLGNAYSDNGSWKDAIRLYERALKIDPRNTDVRTDMGTAYRNMKMPERALSEYREVLQQEPGHLNARYNMGSVYAHDLKDYNVAVHVWEQLLRLAPHYPRAEYVRNCIVTFRKTSKKENPE